MKALIIALALSAFALTAEAQTSANKAYLATSVPLVEFKVKQNQSLQTVTCKQYFGLGDFNQGQAGHLDGSFCTSTGPLLLDDGNVGQIRLNFSFTDGTSVNLEGCGFDTITFSPGYFSYSFNCTH